MKQYHQISAWTDAVRKAREDTVWVGLTHRHQAKRQNSTGRQLDRKLTCV